MRQDEVETLRKDLIEKYGNDIKIEAIVELEVGISIVEKQKERNEKQFREQVEALENLKWENNIDFENVIVNMEEALSTIHYQLDEKADKELEKNLAEAYSNGDL